MRYQGADAVTTRIPSLDPTGLELAMDEQVLGEWWPERDGLPLRPCARSRAWVPESDESFSTSVGSEPVPAKW